MDDYASELTERFERWCDVKDNALPPEIMSELQTMLALYAISPEELDFKWQAYAMKMGGDETKMDLKSARDFKKNIQDTLERESRGKAQARNDAKRVAPTPRAGGKGAGDVFDMLDGLVPNTPHPSARNGVNGSTVKRKSNFETPASKAKKNNEMSSPAGAITQKDGGPAFDFSSRKGAGDITEQLNGQIALPDPPEEAPAETRIKLKANTDMSKFSYKTMAMKLSEASEVLDDRIDEFRQLIQEHHGLEDSAFGNPTQQSPSEIIAVGRIASDTGESKLNNASLVLEGSRRWGSGRRIPLEVDALPSYNFFPGQIVALRGTNASGDFFTVTETLPLPLLNQPATKPADLDTCNTRYLDSAESDPENLRPLTVLIASGPYTTDQALDFSPLHTLLSTATTLYADTLILHGPFLDAEHPLLRTGDFDLPPNLTSPDRATLADLFRHHISNPLNAFAQSLPTCNIILIPHLRDAHHRHAAFPQDKFAKKELGLAKQVHCVTNPMTLTMNEVVLGTSSLDVLDMLRREELIGGRARGVAGNLSERSARNVIEQRAFLPVWPPTGRERMGAVVAVEEKKVVKGEEGEGDVDAGPSPFLPLGTMLDTSYLKLGEMLNVVESVLVINPGMLSKKRAAGTYARMIVNPATVSDEEREKGVAVAHKLWERARVDIVKI
ncbi:DNA polymerase alpha, subunit B [Polyplosphaeria fusca]|uniref:DNA polymerase alpha subunit B n=1 Tax=Polyplosphaeria fusca TaxID=682080 RepID=A0A9P4R3E0_9PLEO|nr:DNA polymerase alpha, subunit B [Polyplosphaeria fusca]